MSDFLFISSPSGHGKRTRVNMNDIAHLFSEGVEEPVIEASQPWRSARQNIERVLTQFSGWLSKRPRFNLEPAAYHVQPQPIRLPRRGHTVF